MAEYRNMKAGDEEGPVVQKSLVNRASSNGGDFNKYDPGEERE